MIENTNQAFLSWYESHHDSFVRFCSSKAFGIMETEDLVQEAVLKTLEGFERIQDKTKTLGYMIGIVQNIIRNQRRRQKFQGDWEELVLEKLESKTLNPEVALDIQLLLKKLNELPEKQSEAITLFEISGFSIREIAAIQDSTEGATKTRISRGRQNLKELLSEKPGTMSVSQRLAVYASILF
ncbi:MAG: RNA polymerase sigma factor [Bacteroidetes bacterium]|jgi:RNA polymerase sigma-70 factor (ECF subfamily)|nr:RNA polymerase sigma factor [Bacteroidota bacterium]